MLTHSNAGSSPVSCHDHRATHADLLDTIFHHIRHAILPGVQNFHQAKRSYVLRWRGGKALGIFVFVLVPTISSQLRLFADGVCGSFLADEGWWQVGA